MAKPEGFAGLPEHHQPTAGRVDRPMERMRDERLAEITVDCDCENESDCAFQAMCEDKAELLQALKAERAEVEEQCRINGQGAEREARLWADVEQLRECVISCGESVLVEGNWRDLPPMVLSSIARYVKENADAESRLSGLVEALLSQAALWEHIPRDSIYASSCAKDVRAHIRKATGEQT